MKKNKLVPKFRFPEFKNSINWNITNLGKISSVVEEKAGKNKYIPLSITSGIGLISQTEKFGKEISGNSYKNYIVIRKYDFAYNKSATKQFPEGFISMLDNYDIAAVPNSIFICFRITDKQYYPNILNYLFYNNYHGYWLRKYIEVGGRAHGSLNFDTKHLWDIPIVLPSLEEQQKIADCLASIDELIDAEKRKLEALKKYKKALMQKLFPAEDASIPELRFEEFKDSEEWENCNIGNDNIFNVISPPKKIVQSNYMISGKYPIIDQSQEYISGWTNDEEAIIHREYPLIIFGDHTCVFKLVKQSFAQGADGIKILEVNKKFYEEFIYYYLQNIPINSNEYKRHYSILKEFDIKFPDKKSGEQQKIADCLASIDSIIEIQVKKIDNLIKHKKALMQGLFPDMESIEEYDL